MQTRRPFTSDDQIVTNEYEGAVQEVNFRSVKLLTFDGETVYVPNSLVLQNPITNWTKTPTRRSTIEIGVAYDDDLAVAQEALVEAAKRVGQIEASPEPQAFVYEFGESSINFAMRFWHGAEILDMWRALDAVAQQLKLGLEDAGCTIPFPQRTLWFGPGNTELSLASESE